MPKLRLRQNSRFVPLKWKQIKTDFNDVKGATDKRSKNKNGEDSLWVPRLISIKNFQNKTKERIILFQRKNLLF